MGARALGFLPKMWKEAFYRMMKISCECGHTFEYTENDIFSHKVLCGDSANVEDVEKLMGNDKADMIFTSPPYADRRTYRIGSFDWEELMNSVSAAMLAIVRETTHILVNLGLVHKNRQVSFYWDKWLKYMADAGYSLFGLYVWDKGSGLPGEWNGRLAPSFEFIFHFNKKCGPANKWIPTQEESQKKDYRNKTFRYPDGTFKLIHSLEKSNQKYRIPDSVIRISRAATAGLLSAHPAVYPVALPEFGCKTWTQEKDIVYEPFAGSGTTVIACEKTKRQCRAIEISEAYVGIIIERYVKFTGNPKIRLNGEPYEWVI